MTTDNRLNRGVFWTMGGLTILLSLLLTTINLSEFVNIAVLDNVEGYPFGGEGPVPYYYKSSQLYALINLIWGLIFLTVLIFGLRSVYNKKSKHLKIAFILTIVLLLLLFVHGKIGVD